MKCLTEFPVKHIEGNIAFGRDGTVWAYYAIEGFGYDFRDVQQKQVPFSSQLAFLVDNIHDLHFLMIPSLTDINGIIDETIERIQEKEYPLKRQAIQYFETLKQTLSQQRSSRETNEYHCYFGVQLDPHKNEKRHVGNLGIAAMNTLKEIFSGFTSPVYRAVGLEPHDILNHEIELWQQQADKWLQSISSSFTSHVRKLTSEEMVFLIEQNFSVVYNDTKLRRGFQTGYPVEGQDEAGQVHGAKRGQERAFYDLQNAEIEEHDPKTLKLYKLVDEDIEETYTQYVVAHHMNPRNYHPGFEWMFHLQNRLPFPVSVSVRASYLSNEQILKKLSDVRLSYEDQKEEARKGGSIVDLSVSKSESGAIQMESRFKETGYPAYVSSFIFRVSAKDKHELKNRVDTLKRELNPFGIQLVTPYGEMMSFFMEFIPASKRYNQDYLQYVEPTILAGMMFGATTNIGDHRGFYIGQTRKLNRPVFIQPDLAAKAFDDVRNKFDSLSVMVAGMTGKGKSFFMNLFTFLSVLTGSHALIIDPKGDRKWSEGLPFIPKEFISIWTLGLSEKDEGCLDPFRTSQDIHEAKDICVDILSFLCGIQLGDVEFTVLSEAVEYEAESDDPCIGGVLAYLQRRYQNRDEQMSNRRFEAIESLMTTLETLERNQLSKLLFGKKGQDYRVLEVDKPLQVLMVQNLSLPSKEKARDKIRPIEKISEAILISITAFTKQYMFTQDRSIHKIILQDEATAIERSDTGKFLLDFIVRQGRYYNTTLLKGTQNASDYDEDVANMGMKFSFALSKVEEAREMLRYFNLPDTPRNAEDLMNLEKGNALFQDIYGRTAVVKIHPVYQEIVQAFDTSTSSEEERQREKQRRERLTMGV